MMNEKIVQVESFFNSSLCILPSALLITSINEEDKTK
jgi:hypothetical protein